MLKRILSVTLCVLLTLSCISCGAKPEEITSEQTEPAPSPDPAPEPTPAPKAEPEIIPEPEQGPETSSEPESEPEPVSAPVEEDFDIALVQPILESGKYIFNPYLLSEECSEAFGEDFLRFYVTFIRALMDHETQCSCPSENYIMYLDMILDYECPFYVWGDIEFNWATNYDYDNQLFTWTYNVEKDVIDRRIADITNAMQEYLDLVSADMAEQDKMQTIYHAFCPKMTYDNDGMVSRENIEPYYAFCEHHGICITFSYALSQILNQIGIYGTLAGGECDDGEAHEWNYVRINGEYYFFDTTFELNYKNGTAYVYYGMTMDERLESGVSPDFHIGKYLDFAPELAEVHLNVR